MNRRTAGLCLICLVFLFLSGFDTATASETETIEKAGLKVQVSLGYNDMARLGRDTVVYITIETKNKLFHGTVQIGIPDPEGKNIYYEKSVYLSQKSSTIVTFPLKIANDFKEITVRIQNAKGKTILQTKQTITLMKDMSKLFVGGLSRNPDNLAYLQGENMCYFPLDAKKLEGKTQIFQMFDVIVVNQVDTGELSDSVMEQLTRWVEDGGTLVLGTGSDYKETTKRFIEAGWFDIKSPKVSKLLTCFGLTSSQKESILTTDKESVVQDSNQSDQAKAQQRTTYDDNTMWLKMLSCTIDGVQNVQSEGENGICDKLAMKRGNLLIYYFDLGAKGIKQHLASLMIKQQIADGLSITAKEQLELGTYTGNESNEMYGAIPETAQKSAPGLFWFVLLLVLYILVIGPSLYFALARYKKELWFWRLLPIASILFTMALITYGLHTAKGELQGRYVTILDYEKGRVREKGLCTITSLYNDTYNFGLDTKQVAVVNSNTFWYKNQASKRRAWVQPGGEQTIRISPYGSQIEIKDYPAYTAHYYSTEYSYQMAGDYKEQFEYGLEGITGSFTNELGCELKNCFLIAKGAIVPIGNVRGLRLLLGRENLSLLVITIPCRIISLARCKNRKRDKRTVKFRANAVRFILS